MFRIRNIFFVVVALLAVIRPVYSQNERVCVGTKVMYKAVGENGSIYKYEVPHQGELIQEYTDSIVVKWSNNKGVFSLGVQETSVHGCEGNWAYLNVKLVGEYARFSHPQYCIGGGSGVKVEFNKSDFKAYSWVEESINVSDGYISKAGTYELKTIDHDNCRLSSFINVVQGPMVNLGRDTLICTPGFRLYALNPKSTPPANTVFTWSTGESGESFFIDVAEHDTEKNTKYWVRADFGECSVSDTIVVLACKDENPTDLNITNTFTPNGDGDNDVWEIPGLNYLYPNAMVEIFDRWGRKVFTSAKGYPQPWNGRDARGHVLPMEAYYYIIHLNDGKKDKPIFGTITIIR